MGEPIRSESGVGKSFGHVQALKNVSFTLNKGEFLGLVGDNGAGKSTFIKVLSGVHEKDGGSIKYEGKEVDFASPKDAIAAGMIMAGIYGL
jgi:ABC-type sugar transport system ATPase subunit